MEALLSIFLFPGSVLSEVSGRYRQNCVLYSFGSLRKHNNPVKEIPKHFLGKKHCICVS